MNTDDKIISIGTLKHYNDKITNYVDEKVSDAVDNLELDELNAILVDTDSVADDPIVSDYVTETELENALKDKQNKLIDGVNIATINGQSLTTGGDLTIESGAKVYEWFYDCESESVTLSQEEYDNIVETDIVIVNLGGIMSCVVSKSGKEFSEAVGCYALLGQVDIQGSKVLLDININISTKLATITFEQQEIPTKTSQLENDSNFVTSDNLKTINGESIYGGGDITIEGGSLTESDIAAMGFTKNTGTIIEVKMNGVSKGTSGVVDLGDTGVYPIVESSETNITLLSNRMTKITTSIVDSLEINLPDENEGYTSECIVTFNIDSSSTSAELIVPADVKWADNVIPSMIAGKTYEISFLNKCATFLEY